MTNMVNRYLEPTMSPSQAAETRHHGPTSPPQDGNAQHLHITLCGIDVIKKGLNCHPFDGNPALEGGNEGISMVLSSVTMVVSHTL